MSSLPPVSISVPTLPAPSSASSASSSSSSISSSSSPPSPSSSSSASSTSQPSQSSSSSSSSPTSSAIPSSSSSAPSSTPSSSSSSSPSATSSSTNSSSSSSSSGTSSTPTASATSKPATSSPSAFTTAVESTNSAGVVVTYTTTIGGAATDSANAAVTSKTFFQNKGAVAGVFTVVGLVGAAIIVALLTNVIRRRRAKKFDRDVALAAEEAARNAHVPDFADDDDYGYPDDRRDFGARSGYSDGSHGTYAQQPMGHGETYNMSELPLFDPYSGGASAAGAAGVGAAGVNRARSTGQKQTTPYNAFAVPPVTMPTPNAFGDSQGPYGPSSSGYGLLEAAGLAGAPATEGLARGPSQHLASQPNANLARNRSTAVTTLSGTTMVGASSSDHAPHPGKYQPPPGNQYGYPVQPTQQPQPGARPISMDDPYDGYQANSPLPNPFEGATSPEPRPVSGNFTSPESSAEGGEHAAPPAWHEEDANRMSIRDEEDYGFGGGRRVLKVANE